MAEKLSKSILRNLDGLRKMLHRDPKKPSTSTSKKPSASTSKKPSASKESVRERGVSPPSKAEVPDQGSAQEATDAKPDKKKTKNQPWYRHRQRW
jgi:hypothetical protein